MNHRDPPKTSARSSRAAGSVGGGGREDYWSEGATETLIESWGDRYIRLNRGNLRQKDWKEVADAVSSRQNGVKPPKTDVQCKNRIDTLKKKYKLEKSKPFPSKWPFFYHLDSLVGSSAVAKKPTSVSITVKSSKPKFNPNHSPNPVVYSGGSKSTGSSFDDDDDGVGFDQRAVRKQRRIEAMDLDGAACRELARAILRFGEIYERIENSKQQRMMELERQRMEFTEELEIQRMNMLMDAQLKLEKMKRQKQAPNSGKRAYS